MLMFSKCLRLMRVTRPVSLSPTRRHDWRSCTWWRLDARLTSGRGLPQAALTACLKRPSFLSTPLLYDANVKMQAATTIFFDFLKSLQFNYLLDFRPFRAPKNCGRAQKNAPKNGRRKPGGRRVSAPSTSSSKTRKKSSEIF